jgi:hypothetical protein
VKPKFTLVLATALAFVACTDDPVSPDLRSDASPPLAISVMTQNAYVGADVDAVIAALGTPGQDDDFQALLYAIQTFQKTDFVARARAFAAQIARDRPHVVGFQEISLIDVDLTPLNLPYDFTIDFLPIIQAALAEQGLNYALGDSILNIDVAVAGGLVRLRDADAVLYDASRVTAWQTQVKKNFEVNIPPEYLPAGIALRRGWIWGVATVGARGYNIVSTHLEAGSEGIPDHPLSQIRAAQTYEIGSVLGAYGNPEVPAIVMGDLNDLPGSPMYGVLADYGFQDVWATLRPGADGFTAPHPYDLSNPTTQFTKRIDYIFARGIGHPNTGLQGQIYRVGEVPADRVRGPQYMIWPSDHAGLVAEFLAPPAKGLSR